jgi:hypothetical protein
MRRCCVWCVCNARGVYAVCVQGAGGPGGSSKKQSLEEWLDGF